MTIGPRNPPRTPYFCSFNCAEFFFLLFARI